MMDLESEGLRSRRRSCFTENCSFLLPPCSKIFYMYLF